ncbi:MAG: MATE family efflux transporter [Paludibacteraceae bacterium]|nr:MATE family efflux transporter [Paludibacteraceae bacterium]
MSFFEKHITPDKLAKDSIWKLLFRFSLPAIIAMSATSLYNLTDSIFIGRGVGAMAMAGLGITLPIMNIVSALGSMVGIGASALFSLLLGQNKNETEKILPNVILLNIILAFLVFSIGFFFTEPLLQLFGASEDIIISGEIQKGSLNYAKTYLKILLFGNLITNMYLSLNELLRVSGYPQKSMLIMLASISLNCVLDGWFIFGLKWGIAGSAYATLCSQSVALLIILLHFSKKTNFIHFSKFYPLQTHIVKSILKIGAASFLLHFCTSIVVFFINNALSPFGDLYIGTYSIINRVVMLFIMIIAGFNQGMQPIVGYNYGAKNNQRALKTLKLTIFCAVIIMSIGCLLAENFPQQIASLFIDTQNENLAIQTQNIFFLNITVEAIRIVFIVFPLIGCQIVISNFFQFIGKPYLSIFLTLTRQILFLIPLLLILPEFFGAKGVWMSMPIADGVASILAIIALFFFLKKQTH